MANKTNPIHTDLSLDEALRLALTTPPPPEGFRPVKKPAAPKKKAKRKAK